jgi:hypothetical protein
MKIQIKTTTVTIISILLLGACGGGGGDKKVITPPAVAGEKIKNCKNGTTSLTKGTTITAVKASEIEIIHSQNGKKTACVHNGDVKVK